LNTTDENGRPFFSVLLYEIDPPYVPFRVSGGYLQNTIPLDAEVNLTYVFQVWASDIGGLKSQPATVIVSVLDENEYIPTFSELIYEAEVQENGDTGMLLLTVSATDEDVGESYSSIRYDSIGTQGLFTINSTTGELFTNGSLDSEKLREHNFHVLAMDGGGLNSTAGVHIVVKDVNEFPPEFDASSYTANVEEDTPLNTTILDLSTFIIDRDSGAVFGQVVEYTLLLHTDIDPYLPFPFDVTSSGAVITANHTLNFDTDEPKYSFQVQAQDGGGFNSEIVNVLITVVNINNREPILQNRITIKVSEDTEIHSLIAVFSDYVVDTDNSTIPLDYYFLEGNSISRFFLAVNGSLYLHEYLQREVQSSYQLHLVVWDGRYYSNVSRIRIEVTKVNEHRPVFDQPYYNVTITENSPPGSINITIRATDADSLNSQDEVIVSYHFTLAPIEDNPFELTVHANSGLGILTNTRPLDFEQGCFYQLAVSETDED